MDAKSMPSGALEGGPMFPLFDLPAEIRIRIYRFILLESGGYRDSKSGQTVVTITSRSRCPPLLAVCRETRKEGIAIYYRVMHFEFRDGRLLKPWLGSRSPEARKRIEFVYVFQETFPYARCWYPELLSDGVWRRYCVGDLGAE